MISINFDQSFKKVFYGVGIEPVISWKQAKGVISILWSSRLVYLVNASDFVVVKNICCEL